ncbi:MAG: hypothetical protein WC596_04210 [Candidatus Shapirobacteria bacterium]
MLINDTVAKYLDLRLKKAKLESDLSQVEQELADYCRQNKKRSLTFRDQILTVVQKTKTVFPSKSDPKRKELEQILKSFDITTQFKTIDITRLASAYDLKKLPADLNAALKPLATAKPFIRISLLPASRRS